jgi:hypothetical protein
MMMRGCLLSIAGKQPERGIFSLYIAFFFYIKDREPAG